jgi:RimJ/RimL family protein N-acetyltransferase
MAIIEARGHSLANGQTLVIRSPVEDDARTLIDYARRVSDETNYLSFSPADYTRAEPAERAALREFAGGVNRLALVGSIDDAVVSMLTFTGGSRPRIRHVGEFGITVRRSLWGLGIAGVMLDTLIGWAYTSGVVTKINLRVRTDNARAIALYERKGFVREGTLRRDICVDGRYYDHHVMGIVTGPALT